jgi:O-succinylhomoserine sulfhydrylase
VSEKKFETKAIRHQMTRTNQKEHSVPIYATSSYQFDDAEDARALFAGEKEGNIYSRYSNPNNDEFIEKLCLLVAWPWLLACRRCLPASFPFYHKVII